MKLCPPMVKAHSNCKTIVYIQQIVKYMRIDMQCKINVYIWQCKISAFTKQVKYCTVYLYIWQCKISQICTCTFGRADACLLICCILIINRLVRFVIDLLMQLLRSYCVKWKQIKNWAYSTSNSKLGCHW